jgi:hypothetical protein
MSDPVPAITEADATGEIAEIFADIRCVLEVGVVNLIWRHLATLPGALPWVWGALGPLYADGTIEREAAALRGTLALPELPAFPAEVFAAAGLIDEDLQQIRNVLDTYHRTNAMALIALSAVLSRLDGTSSDTVHALSASANLPRVPQAPLMLPSMLDLADMSPATAKLVVVQNRLGTRHANPLLASMYRHLAHWPPYLALAWTLIAPLDADGRLHRVMAEVLAQARSRAAGIAGRLPMSDAMPEPGVCAAVGDGLGHFTDEAILKMVVICALLRKATGGR